MHPASKIIMYSNEEKKNKELHITKKKLGKFNSYYTLSFEAFLSLSETIDKFRKGKRESFL